MPRVADVPKPKLEHPFDVIVRVAGAGVCRTDLHLIDGIWKDALGSPKLPYTLGHENSGWLDEVGSAVTELSKGDPVILHRLITCGTCRACRSGNDMHCASSRFPGLDGTDGGYAEYVKTSLRSVVREVMRRAGFKERPYVLRNYFDTAVSCSQSRIARWYAASGSSCWASDKGKLVTASKNTRGIAED